MKSEEGILASFQKGIPSSINLLSKFFLRILRAFFFSKNYPQEFLQKISMILIHWNKHLEALRKKSKVFMIHKIILTGLLSKIFYPYV